MSESFRNVVGPHESAFLQSEQEFASFFKLIGSLEEGDLKKWDEGLNWWAPGVESDMIASLKGNSGKEDGLVSVDLFQEIFALGSVFSGHATSLANLEKMRTEAERLGKPDLQIKPFANDTINVEDSDIIGADVWLVDAPIQYELFVKQGRIDDAIDLLLKCREQSGKVTAVDRWAEQAVIQERDKIEKEATGPVDKQLERLNKLGFEQRAISLYWETETEKLKEKRLTFQTDVTESVSNSRNQFQEICGRIKEAANRFLDLFGHRKKKAEAIPEVAQMVSWVTGQIETQLKAAVKNIEWIVVNSSDPVKVLGDPDCPVRDVLKGMIEECVMTFDHERHAEQPIGTCSDVGVSVFSITAGLPLALGTIAESLCCRHCNAIELAGKITSIDQDADLWKWEGAINEEPYKGSFYFKCFKNQVDKFWEEVQQLYHPIIVDKCADEIRRLFYAFGDSCLAFLKQAGEVRISTFCSMVFDLTLAEDELLEFIQKWSTIIPTPFPMAELIKRHYKEIISTDKTCILGMLAEVSVSAWRTDYQHLFWEEREESEQEDEEPEFACALLDLRQFLQALQLPPQWKKAFCPWLVRQLKDVAMAVREQVYSPEQLSAFEANWTALLEDMKSLLQCDCRELKTYIDTVARYNTDKDPDQIKARVAEIHKQVNLREHEPQEE